MGLGVEVRARRTRGLPLGMPSPVRTRKGNSIYSLFNCYYLAMSHGIQDLSSPTRV